MWTPKRQIISTALFEGNLVTYIKTHQADALVWAGGVNLKPFTFPDENLANESKPNLPVLYVTDKTKSTGGEDLLTAEWTISFEGIVGTSSASTVAPLTAKYMDALESMLSDIDSNLVAGSAKPLIVGDEPKIVPRDYETGSNEAKTAFFKRFTMSATYEISGSAY